MPDESVVLDVVVVGADLARAGVAGMEVEAPLPE